MRERVMFIERKAGELTGDARIGRVRFSKTGRTLYFGGRSFARIKGYKANHVCLETGEEYWISGPKKDGRDRLYGERLPVTVDEDCREEYLRLRGITAAID